MAPTGLNAAGLRSERLDWEGLRTQSLEPGGFGAERVTIWYLYDFSSHNALAHTCQGLSYYVWNLLKTPS